MTLFELVAKLVLDTSGFDKDVNSANSAGDSLSKQLKKTTASAVAMGNAVWHWADRASKAMWNFAGDLVQTAADVQAEQVRFASVFGDNAGDANAIFKELADANNIYITRLRNEGTSMYAQFKAGGADTADSLDMMTRAMQLAADGAAVYDVSLEEASYRLRSFLRGNVEAGESIGLFANNVSRSSKAAEMFGAEWKDLNEAQREAVLLAIAEDAYANSDATGQAAREAEYYTNVLGNLQARWREVKATLGAPILNALTPVIDELGTFLEENPELVQKFADGLGIVAKALSDMFISAIAFVGDHAEEISGFLDGVNSLLLTADGFFRSLSTKGFEGVADESIYKEPGDYRAMAQEMRSNPSQYGITQAEADAWIDALLNVALTGIRPDNYMDMVREIQEAYDKGTDDDSGKEDDDDLRSAVTELRTAVDNLPSMLVTALSGVSVGIDAGPLLGYFSAGLARNARQNKNTSTASA